MLRGVYTAASGMLLEGLKTDIVANNLANAATTGYKRQQFSVRDFPTCCCKGSMTRCNWALVWSIPGLSSAAWAPAPPSTRSRWR